VFGGLGGFVDVDCSFLFVRWCGFVDAQVGLGRFDVELVPGASEVQRPGFDQWSFALTEQVDDVFAAVGFDLVRVADGFGDLRTGVNAFKCDDFTQVRRRVESAFLQAVVKGFGVFSELEEAL